MMNNHKQVIEFIAAIKQEYCIKELPFLTKQLTRVKKNKPYKRISILHNIPFTKETILKLEILYAGGANITVTSPSFLDVDKDLVQKFKTAGGNWKRQINFSSSNFDFYLDCAAELIDKPPPKIGTVEITGTGTNKYSAAELVYPVISVDQSKIKFLEGVLGTGEAFVRAFKELTNENIENKHFMIFGYGKVGRGIAYYLKKETNNIVVIEKDNKCLQEAKEAGYTAIAASKKKRIENLAKAMFTVITATGIKNVISNNYDSKCFISKYLSNMGGEDEFGEKFPAESIMCNKRPINFFIEKPTLMRYLDPVFYAHNLAIDILLYSNLKNGLYPFPEFISEEVVSDWVSIFKENINI